MSQYTLVADVGATNARFALLLEGDAGLQEVKVLPCADYPSLPAAVQSYLASINTPGSLTAACIAIAGAVHLPVFELANNHWQVDKAQVNKSLAVDVLWVNDFTAQAWAMSKIAQADLLQIKQGQAVAAGNRLVIGPGTGLGVAGLVAHGEGWLPVMGEGGHVSLAPENQLQSDILAYMWRQHKHVSVERLLSGSGIMNLYAAVAHVQGLTPHLSHPAQVLKLAQLPLPDPLAAQALAQFCAMLGHAVGNAALLYGAVGGVYLTGGILPRMTGFLKESEFVHSFTEKGRLKSYLQEIPIYLCQAEQPGLQGAAIALQQSLRS